MKIHESYSDFINEKRVEYTAVVLDDASKERLLSELRGEIPEGWKVITHHMTIAFAEGLEAVNRTEDEGRIVELYTTHLGISDKAIAVKVEGYPTTNKIAHITVAVNAKEGGKPVMSNDIKNWHKMHKIKLIGKVTEILK